MVKNGEIIKVSETHSNLPRYGELKGQNLVLITYAENNQKRVIIKKIR